MKAYVIKNKEGKFWGYCDVNGRNYYYARPRQFAFFNTERQTKKIIKIFKIKDCTIVPITICEGDLENYIESIEKVNDKLAEERYIFKKALELACDGYVKPNVYGTDIWEEAEKCGGLEQYFIQQAKESEKDE